MCLNLPGSDIRYLEIFLTDEESYKLFSYMNSLNIWKSKEFMMFGRICKQNRETCCFSNKGINYKYNGFDNYGNNIEENSILDKVKSKLEKFLKTKFNYILCNRYKDGTQNIGMHSDDERGLNGPIASISVGSNRYFDIHKKDKSIKHRIDLKNGSLLVMGGDTQKNYKHGVPIQKKIKKPRINLTFRNVS